MLLFIKRRCLFAALGVYLLAAREVNQARFYTGLNVELLLLFAGFCTGVNILVLVWKIGLKYWY